jgi:predicted DNA-binding transcriptional regulator YafY
MTKSERYLRVLLELGKSPHGRLSEAGLRALLGDPSKASWHRYLLELTEESVDMPAVLMKIEHEGERSFKLNHEGWRVFKDAELEGLFMLEAYRRLGFLLDSDFSKLVHDEHDPKFAKKFLYLTHIKSRSTAQTAEHLSKILHALIHEKELEVSMDGHKRTLRPLTLCQYRDDLYVIGERKKGESSWEERTYKITRLDSVKVTEQTFSYPKSWNPENAFKKTSGLMGGESKRVQLHVHGFARRVFQEKTMFNGFMSDATKDYDQWECEYTNVHEFLGQIFGYIDEIHFPEDGEVKEEALKKLSKAFGLQELKSKVG